jgi:murein DD-endopeptidase MepM/ murein hydrolase activator NlpD
MGVVVPGARGVLRVSAALVLTTSAVLCPPWGLFPARSDATLAATRLATDAAAPLQGGLKDGTLSPIPLAWAPSHGRECIKKGRYARFCQGPRRVPAPFGDAQQLAKQLHLGTIKTVSHLLLKPPMPEWLAAAGAQPDQAVDKSLLWPVAGGRFWRGFGKTRTGARKKLNHDGVDIGAADGTPIRAAQSGLVAYSDNGVRGYGNLLVLIHPHGAVTSYAHCTATYVFAGQRVERGQVIGEVGHTGIARGPHLHFEYRERGRVRDPWKYFVDRPAHGGGA